MHRQALVSMAATLFFAAAAPAADKAVHIVYMGGNDCPPCRAWRANELPKLEKMESFKRAKFTYVDKLIGSSVPPWIFLPSDVKPYKDKLDAAANGVIGSPQAALIVDGQVYDYWFGTRTAAQYDAMLRAIYEGRKYPFDRCLRRQSQEKCAVKAPPA